MTCSINDIRDEFVQKYLAEEFTESRLGEKTIEIIGASFIADEDAIFGKPNQEYIDAESSWYLSASSNINDIYGEDRDPPKPWTWAANEDGEINSNYGLLTLTSKYYNQYANVKKELIDNPDSRRASMVYQRPSIWEDYKANGKNDFICTNAVTYYNRNNQLDAVVQMRSGDAWAGYRNDFAWQQYLLKSLALDLKMTAGYITWQVQNLHVYDRNFYLIDHFNNTGEIHISKNDYLETYK